jgi:cobalt-zinc-cadmium efflux system outer membrane protein
MGLMARRNQMPAGSIVTTFVTMASIASTALLLAGSLAASAYAESDLPLALPGILAAAEAHNPRLAAMEAHLASARAMALVAGTLEAPKLGFGLMNVPSLGGPSVTLSRMFPGPDKLRLAREAALHDADQADAELAAERRMVASEVEQAYYEAVTMQQMYGIRLRIQAQLKQLLAIAAARYANGMGMQQDPLMVQFEQARLDRDLIENVRAIATARAHLNTLANRPLDAALALPVALPKPTVLPSEATLHARAEADEPRLRGIQAQVAAAASRTALANKHAGTPDFDVAVTARRIMPGDMSAIGGMVGIDLPWLAGDRFTQMVTQAERRQGEAEARLTSRRNEVHLQVRTLLNQLARTDRQLELYRKGLLPIANQSLAASLAAYQVGKADMATVLANQRAIFETTMDETTVLGAHFQAIAMLEPLVGGLVSDVKRAKQ